MLVASSNVSPASFGAATKRRNSRDLLQRYFSPRQVMSFSPLVDQFATEVNTAAREGGAIRFPQIGHDRLPRRQPFESVRRHRKSFCADVFAESKKRVMAAQIIDGRSDAFVDLDLLNPGIALDVKNAIAYQQVVVEFLGAANVQDGVGVAIKLTDFL